MVDIAGALLVSYIAAYTINIVIGLVFRVMGDEVGMLPEFSFNVASSLEA